MQIRYFFHVTLSIKFDKQLASESPAMLTSRICRMEGFPRSFDRFFSKYLRIFMESRN